MDAKELREKLLSGKTLKTKTLAIDIAGEQVSVTIRGLSCCDANRLRDLAKSSPDVASASWIVLSVYSDEGQPVFTLEDVAEIDKSLSNETSEKLLEAIMSLNGLRKEDQEVSEKNSVSGLNAASS